MSFDVTHEALK